MISVEHRMSLSVIVFLELVMMLLHFIEQCRLMIIFMKLGEKKITVSMLIHG